MSNYLYNGVELPPLGGWGKEGDPYGMLDQISALDTAILFLFSEVEYSHNSYGDYGIQHPSTDPYYKTTKYGSNPWGAWTNDTGGSWQGKWIYNDHIWANFDYVNEDGTIGIKASNPIDAETGEEIHDYEIVEPEPVPTLTNRDLYRKINGQLVKHTLYKKVGGELVKVDEYST
jgi:hypothetical protein